MATIPEGYAFISGPRSKERSQAVLAATRELGLDVTVVSVNSLLGGYIAPAEVAEKLNESSAVPTSSVRDIDSNGEPVTVAPSGLSIPEAIEAQAEADPDGSATAIPAAEEAPAEEPAKTTTTRKSTAKSSS